MNKTANFQLTQWEKTDRIMMEDFNRDNAAIDTALKGNADKAAALQTALASCGNCKIVYGRRPKIRAAALTSPRHPPLLPINRLQASGS